MGKNSLERTRDTALTGAESMELESDQTKQALFGRSVETAESAFGLSQAQARFSIASGLLSGKSYGQLQGAESTLLDTETGNASALRGFAANPINSPAERNKYLAEATGFEQSAAQERYQFRMAGYAQNLAGDDLRLGQASLGTAQAQISGGPQDVYQARGKEIEEYQAKIAELSSELSRGGLTVDDAIAKERQLTDARQQSTQAAFSRNQSLYNDTYGLDSTLEGNAEVGLGRRIQRGGNAGAGTTALALSLTAITDAENHLGYDRKNYGGNKQLIADDEGRVARAQESREELLDRTNAYQPGGAFARKLMNDKTDFQITMEAPYMDGNPENNPVTRGAAVLGNLNKDMSGIRQNRARLQMAGQWRDEDETHYTEQINSDRLQVADIEAKQRRGFLEMLPEMIAGNPGRGNTSGVLPTPGQSAFYSGNPFITGTFGKPNIGSDGESHVPQAGGLAGAFLAATGGFGAMSRNVGEAILSELKRLNGNVERSNQIGGRSPAVPSPSGYSTDSHLATNAYRPGR